MRQSSGEFVVRKLISVPIESLEEAGPFGAKSIGECATDGVAGAVVNAVSHALGNVRLDRMPLTPEYLRSVMK